jgi:hypothetical protein
MICIEAAEFVSALCDGEMIPPTAAEHIGTCPACQGRLRDYLAMGVELRRIASIEQSAPITARSSDNSWTRPQNPLTAFIQKGSGTMRIPRLAFAAMIAGIVALACTLAVVKVGARSTGTVVLLNTVSPDGTLWACPLSTQDTNQSCERDGKMSSQNLAYRVRLVSRDGSRVLLAIHTRTFTKGDDLSSFNHDSDPAAKVTEVWFEPGEASKVDVPNVGTFTLTGEWMDHMPILIGSHGEDVSPGPNEIRIASPVLLKDKKLVGDFVSVVSGVFSMDEPDRAMWIYQPGQGGFLLSLSPMKGAVEASVTFSRISFEEGGHTWEFVTGNPVCRGDHLWVLHQAAFKPASQKDQLFIVTQALVQTAPGEWSPTGHQ